MTAGTAAHRGLDLRRLPMRHLLLAASTPLIALVVVGTLLIGRLPVVSPTAIGNVAPDFALVDLDGNPIQLSELRGQPVFLNFWATWCTFCLEEMPDMQRIAEQFDDQLVVLGVNAGDSVAAGDGFANRIGATYELVYDTEQQVVAGYRVRAMPSSYFIDAEGRIVDAHLGFLTRDDMLEKVTALLDQGGVRP